MARVDFIPHAAVPGRHCCSCVILALVFHQAMLFLVAIGAIYRLFTKDAALAEDRTCLLQYSMLLMALAVVSIYSPLK